MFEVHVMGVWLSQAGLWATFGMAASVTAAMGWTVVMAVVDGNLGATCTAGITMECCVVVSVGLFGLARRSR